MSKINLASQQWCDLVFEGRNKAYGAYRLRASQGNRQLRSVILVLVGIAVVLIGLALKSTIANAFGGNDDGSQT
ncbi:MAG: energy transducer TonB, partial [Alloprevotella tannerae]|nr:energy transducer TonB [Alloprevotella tannerae]